MSISKKIARLSYLVRFMPKGRDRDDLLYVLEKAEQYRRKNHSLYRKVQRREQKIRQLKGAFKLSQYYLDKANQKIEQQRLQIKWLGKLVRKKIPPSIEIAPMIDNIINRARREKEIIEGVE